MYPLLQGVVRQRVRQQLQRNLSFLGRFCKKESNKGDSTPDKSVDITLENAFKLYNFDNEPEAVVCLKRSQALSYYRQMQTIRRMETACAALYRTKDIRGFCHLYVGQEACAVGMKAAMRDMDSVITSYRSHGWTYIMGVSPYGIIAELMQKQTGCSRGRGGSMHTYAKNFYGGNGIVGAQVPLGAGVALAHAYRCDGGVCFTLYGDGAANQGQVFESYNIACLWQLPAIFVCENNMYGMGTSVQRSSCCTTYYTRGDYIPGVWVDGMDVLAVRSAAEFAIKYAITCGPVVMECETYRYHGHSMSDPGISYRSREEVERVRKTNDPLINLKNLCIKHNLVSEEEFKKIDEEVKLEIDEAVKQAKADPFTDPNELCADVYVKNYENRTRNVFTYDLVHKNIGTTTIPLGTPKATPKSQIKEPPPPSTEPAKEAKDAKDATKDAKDATKEAKAVDNKEQKPVVDPESLPKAEASKKTDTPPTVKTPDVPPSESNKTDKPDTK